MDDQLKRDTLAIASHMVELRRLAVTSGFQMGTVVSVQAASGGAPRTCTVTLEERGEVPGVGMAVHQASPSPGDGVWLVRVGPQGWLLWGVVG